VPKPIAVVVADESENVRLLLASILRADERFGAVTAVASAAEVLSSCADADVVIVDLVLADGDAFSLMDGLRERRPDLPVVVYTAVGPPYLRAEAAARGAVAYFTHADDSDAVLDAVVRLVGAVSQEQNR
jgi:DNA-binding NtrC family response regulator